MTSAGNASRCAIVASELPGYANVARSGRDALLVPPGDSAALASALLRVLEEPGLSETLVASGFDRAAGFSMDRLAERYVEIYRSVR